MWLRSFLAAGLVQVLVAVVSNAGWAVAEDVRKLRRLDPAAWGDDHVGKPLPSYVTGDECLFCHRTIGATWGDNPHQLTIRRASPDEPAVVMLRRLEGGDRIAAESRYLMGSKRITRFLRRSNEYGKLELLSTSFIPNREDRTGAKDARALPKVDTLKNSDSLAWDKKTFADRCAGCHATAVHMQTRAFSAVSLDCFTCHGDVELDHTKDISRVLLSTKSRDDRQVVSICGQCHLRGGKSKSSGLPYPNTFVAGDNLFRDFQVDFSQGAIRAHPAVEQHMWLSARDVAVFDQPAMNCLICHDVHGQSTEKHQQLENAAICSSCHVPGSDNTELRDALLPANRRRTHSLICDY